MTVGERIAHARRLAGISAMDLGDLALLSRATVAMIERGDRPDPSGSTVAALAGVLGVATDWLLTGVGKEPTERSVKAAVSEARSTVTKRKAAKDRAEARARALEDEEPKSSRNPKRRKGAA